MKAQENKQQTNCFCSREHILDTMERHSNYQNDYQMAALR